MGYSRFAFAFFQPTSLNVQCAFRQPDDMRFSVYLINHIPNPPAGGKQQSIAMSGQFFACKHIFINFWSRFHSFLCLCASSLESVLWVGVQNKMKCLLSGCFQISEFLCLLCRGIHRNFLIKNGIWKFHQEA